MAENGYESPLCSSCNKRVIKLVSISDNGKGPKICQKCKKAMQNQIPIERFDRGAVNYGEIEAEMAKKAKAIVEAHQ